MNICVFCGSRNVSDIYRESAQILGTLIGERGHSLVWGGTYGGLMGDLASATRAAGGKIIAVSVQNFRHRIHPDADEVHIMKDLASRKSKFIEHADAFIALVGGSGTLDEITDMLEQRKYGNHDKPIAVLNTAGFYDGLKELLTRMDTEGFLSTSADDGLYFADTPLSALTYVEGYRA